MAIRVISAIILSSFLALTVLAFYPWLSTEYEQLNRMKRANRGFADDLKAAQRFRIGIMGVRSRATRRQRFRTFPRRLFAVGTQSR